MPGGFGLAGAPALKFELSAVDLTAVAFAKVQRNLALTGERMALVNRSAQGIFGGKMLGGFGGALLAASLVDPIGKIKEIVDEAGNLVNTADKIGLTTKALQELNYVGEKTGVTAEDMAAAMSFFSRQIGEASRGSGDLYDILRANNVAIRDQDGKMRPLLELLFDYVDLIQNAGSSQERSALNAKAFGKAHDELINSFSRGSGVLRQGMEEADQVGRVLGNALLRDNKEIGDKWDDYMGRLETGFEGFVLKVVSGAEKVVSHIRRVSEASPNAKYFRLPPVPGAAPGLNPDGGGLGAMRDAVGFGGIGKKTTSMGPDLKAEQAAKRMQERVDATINSLQLEAQMLGMTSREQAVYNAYKEAGIDANSRYAPSIRAVAEANFDAKQAQAELNQVVGAFGDLGFDAFDRLVLRGEDLKDVLGDLVYSLEKMVLQAALIGEGQLAGFFGIAVASQGDSAKEGKVHERDKRLPSERRGTRDHRCGSVRHRRDSRPDRPEGFAACSS